MQVLTIENRGKQVFYSVRHKFDICAEQNLVSFPLERRELGIYFCDSCLELFCSTENLLRHLEICPCRYSIPGNVIYNDIEAQICIFTLDGREAHCSMYARRLTHLSNLFLEDKAALDDVHFFLFNVLYEIDDTGYHFVGYFSKEIYNPNNWINSISCVMILPPYRKKGYGSLLVELSYEILRRENRCGTPERPLSSNGVKLFLHVWQEEILRVIALSIAESITLSLSLLCSKSGMVVDDVLVALEAMGCMYMIQKQVPFIVLPSHLIDEKFLAPKLNTRLLR